MQLVDFLKNNAPDRSPDQKRVNEIKKNMAQAGYEMPAENLASIGNGLTALVVGAAGGTLVVEILEEFADIDVIMIGLGDRETPKFGIVPRDPFFLVRENLTKRWKNRVMNLAMDEDKVAGRVQGRQFDFIILNRWTDKEQHAKDLETYLPLVRDNGLLVGLNDPDDHPEGERFEEWWVERKI